MPATLMEIDAQPADVTRKAEEAAEKLESGQLTIDVSDLSPDVIALVAKTLRCIASGSSVSVSQPHSDMTTSEVADYLNVSRTYVIRLMEEGKLPYYNVGTHKRVSYQDALRYKTEQRQRSREALQALADQAQELGMGY